MNIRTASAIILAPLLKATGYRFSKSWRHGDTVIKSFVYEHMLDTVIANQRAGLEVIQLDDLVTFTPDWRG